MTDLVQLLIQAGRGGDGRVSFLRAKYQPKGGPDGGDGGDGGSVYIVLNKQLASLSNLAGVRQVAATAGQRGGPRLQRGHAGEDITIEVPSGTHVWQVAANVAARRRDAMEGISGGLSRPQSVRQQFALEYVGGPYPVRPDDESALELAEKLEDASSAVRPDQAGWELLTVINEENPKVLLSQGGFGGVGNDHFKGSTNRTPLQAEWGSFGEERLVVLEQKLLADVGLVGLPNAGKSTLLSVLTKATPKIGAYPFTTLEPHLGVLQGADGSEKVIADIPGLIEGASQGKGLGHDFLRHVEHCTALLYVISPEDADLSEAADDGEELGKRLISQLELVRTEVREYRGHLEEKASVVVLNKIDLVSAVVAQKMLETVDAHLRSSTRVEVPVAVSAATRQGLPELVRAVDTLVASK